MKRQAPECKRLRQHATDHTFHGEGLQQGNKAIPTILQETVLP
jgi:hypothetical protein